MVEFKEKTAEELKELSVDELAGYYNEMNAHKAKELNDKVDSKADQNEIDILKKELEELRGVQLKTMQAQIESQAIRLKKAEAKDGIKRDAESDYLNALKEVCNELQEKNTMLKLKDSDGNNIKIHTKAVGDMSLAGNTTGDIPQADRRDGINILLQRPLNIYDLATKYTTDSDKVEWVYEDNEEGGAGLTAEADSKTQSDREWIVASQNVYKITSYVKVTTEMLKFVNNMRANIDNRLIYLVNEKADDYLLTGTGSSQPMGVTQNAQPLDNAGLYGSIPGLDANVTIWDCAGAMISQVYTEAYGPIVRGAFVMHPTDVYKMVYGSKNSAYEYVYPVTVTPNGVAIGGFPVIQDTGITAGNILFGDFSKFYIAEAGGTEIKMGYDGNDFTENKVTILAEKFFASYVMANDYNFFVYDAIADMKVFLSAGS